MALKFFRPKETEILEILITRMVGTDQPDAPNHSSTSKGKATEYAPTAIIDDFVAKLPEDLRGPLRQALHLFQWCPIVFIGKPRLFAQLSSQRAEAYIRTWAESRFGLRRRIFRGLRDLTFLGYYSYIIASSHPQGTLRMGSHPRHSVVDTYGEAHAVKGLFVTDASLFPSSIGIPPTLTIATLADRIARRLVANWPL